MRTFAIGDVHGCLNALETLLAALELGCDDRLVFLGDYVDRGPDSRGVIKKLLELSANPRHVFLRGNHDDWMLSARTDRKLFKSWLAAGGDATLRSYGATTLDELPDEHLRFLEETHFCFESADHIFAHAAVSASPLQYNEPRWLMWGRFDDVMEHPSGHRIVVGHTSQPSGLPLDKGFLVGIDTACCSGGWLSALEVKSNAVVQADENCRTRRFKLGENVASSADR